MQKDPNKAKQLYGKDPEFNEFFKLFSSMMADHFSKISEKKEAENPLNDKEVQEIIQDPKVNAIIQKLQLEGKLDVMELERDPALGKKIKTLIDKGVFRIQRESELNKK